MRSATGKGLTWDQTKTPKKKGTNTVNEPQKLKNKQRGEVKKNDKKYRLGKGGSWGLFLPSSGYVCRLYATRRGGYSASFKQEGEWEKWFEKKGTKEKGGPREGEDEEGQIKQKRAGGTVKAHGDALGEVSEGKEQGGKA